MLRLLTNRKTMLSFILGAALTLATNAAVQADQMTFNFDYPALSFTATNSAVQTYMRGILTANSAGTVDVTGALGGNNYAGEGYVVGPRTGTPGHYVVMPVTLGPDNFLVNDTAHTDRITMTFTLPLGYTIGSISFDYEIFPNGSCPRSSNCSTWPEFTLTIDAVTQLHTVGIIPGQQGTYLYSPNHKSSPETAPQFLGSSGIINVNDSDNVTTFQFIDWPAMIGVDNLVINYTPPQRTNSVPEPSLCCLV